MRTYENAHIPFRWPAVPPQIYVEDNDLFGIDENEPEVIVSNRELLIVRYRVPDMELETREDYVMEGGGQNWHTYYNTL